MKTNPSRVYVMDLKWSYVKNSSWQIYIFDNHKDCFDMCEICYWSKICKPKEIDFDEVFWFEWYIKVFFRSYNN